MTPGVRKNVHNTWQAQYLVRLEGESCCSAHCVMRINDASHLSWQAQYLVTLVDDTGGSAQYKRCLKCHEDQSWAAFVGARTVIGDVGG